MSNQPTNNTDRAQNGQHALMLVKKIFLPLLLIIAIISLITDSIFTKVLTQKAELSNSYKLGKLENQEDYNNEIGIFGPSIARNAYYCDSLGPNYYNYCMENAGVVINELLIRIEASKDKNTPIIMDYHFRFLEQDHTGSSINLRTYLPYVRKDKRIKDFLVENDKFRPHQVIPGGRYFGVYSSYTKDYLAEYYQPRKEYHRGGVFNKKAPSESRMNELIKVRKDKGMAPFIRNAEYEARLEKIFADNPERPFLLIGSARHYSIIDMLEGYDDMKGWGAEMQNKYQNVRVVIFEADYPDSYFKDTGHLSLEGAKVFSGQMRESLKDIGLYFTGEEASYDLGPRPDDIILIKLEDPA
ncbi:MAG: hypothetical protein ACI959_000368 [Limisphaerales bacterium]|jgi:hypothetical protein